MDNIVEKLLENLVLTTNDILKKFSFENMFFKVLYGNPEIVFVAHVDTLAKDVAARVYRNTIITNTLNYPIGGDDRCGVTIIEALQNLTYPPMCILFNYEEIGCLGSKVFGDIYKSTSIFGDTKLFVGLDRRSNNFVTYSKNDEQFNEYVAKMKIGKMEFGTISDVRILSDIFGIANINLGVGFYKEHTTREFIIIDEFLCAYEKALRIYHHKPKNKLKNKKEKNKKEEKYGIVENNI